MLHFTDLKASSHSHSWLAGPSSFPPTWRSASSHFEPHFHRLASPMTCISSAATQSAEKKRLYEEERAKEDMASTTGALTAALMESLPHLSEERLVQLLEFVAVQHSGKNFNPDNVAKEVEIIAFLKTAPYATTPEGVSRYVAAPGLLTLS